MKKQNLIKKDLIFDIIFFIKENPNKNTREVLSSVGIEFGSEEYTKGLDILVDLQKKKKIIADYKEGVPGIDLPFWRLS